MATNFWLRPHLLPPVRKTMSLLGADQFNFVSSNGSPLTIDAQGSGPPNSWTLSSELLTNSGHVASSAQRAAFLHHYCPHVALPPSGMPGHRAANGPSPAAFEACRAQAVRVFHLVVTYEPANRYWTLQWLETGVFVLLALICAAACYWRVVRLTK
jgi:hypothetical protein